MTYPQVAVALARPTRTVTSTMRSLGVFAVAVVVGAILCCDVVAGAPLGGLYGVDVSQPTSESAFRCMKTEHAVSFVIIRSYTELGSSDSAVVATAKAARAAGIDVGVYHFPDTSKDAHEVRGLPPCLFACL